MKITDPDIIKNGEKDLIEAIKDDLDPDTIQKIMQERMTSKAISSKGGEIVVHNNQIAFRMDFTIEIEGSVMFDREGNYISQLESDDQDDLFEDPLETSFEEDPEDIPESDENEAPADDLMEDTLLDENLMDDSMADMDDDIADIDEDIMDENDDIVDEDIVDDDINDILKESQDFWESKKDE